MKGIILTELIEMAEWVFTPDLPDSRLAPRDPPPGLGKSFGKHVFGRFPVLSPGGRPTPRIAS